MSPNDFWQRRVREGAILNPIDRTSEVLFGLIMVLTFTGAISVSNDGRQEVRDLLWAALGCNLAWGLVDAIMYWMNVVLERGYNVQAVKKIRNEKNPEGRRSVMRENFPPALLAVMTDNDLDRIAAKLIELPEPGSKDVLTVRDLWSGIQIFLLVFLCTFPVALPFGLIEELSVAMRASTNAVALVLLFVGGYRLARYAGFRPFVSAIIYTLIGLALVTVTMALGGRNGF